MQSDLGPVIGGTQSHETFRRPLTIERDSGVLRLLGVIGFAILLGLVFFYFFVVFSMGG